MATIRFNDIRKKFGEDEVIHGVNIDISDGEFIVIVGPSGCGKSTLLRMLAGLEEVTSGEISINDKRVNELEPKDRDIAMVFQNYALYPHMSVYKNMAYGLKLRKIAKTEINRRVDEVTSLLQLDGLLNRKPRQLSGGQRQRVAMGRAIVREPSVFLFDEPLSNLDAKLRVQMRLDIKRLQQRLEVTSLYVTHDQVEAMTMADRLVVMNAGNAEQIGNPLEIYHQPNSVFVATFIGSPSMNIFKAQKMDEHTLAIQTGGNIRLPPEIRLMVNNFQLGIRPEHFDLTQEESAVMQMQVDAIEPLGAETLVHGSPVDSAQVMTIRLDGAADIDLHSVINLTVSSEHLHFFDYDSGKKL